MPERERDHHTPLDATGHHGEDGAAGSFSTGRTGSELRPDPVDLGLTSRYYRPRNAVVSERSEYWNWRVRELRAECSKRGVTITGIDNKEARIAALERYDRVAAERVGHLGQPGGTAASSVQEPKRTKHCWFRLVNVLSSNGFCERLARTGTATGDDSSRLQTVAAAEAERLKCWEDVAIAYKDDHAEYRQLKHDHRLFQLIDPGVIREHSATKLLSLWNELQTNFQLALRKSRTAGDQLSCMSENISVLYVWMEAQQSPSMMAFVNGGSLEEANHDSIRAQLPPRLNHESTRTLRPLKKKPAPSQNMPLPSTHESPPTAVVEQQEQQGGVNHPIQGMLRSVSVPLLDNTHAEHRSPVITIASYQELDDLRGRIITIHAALETASGLAKRLLEEDLDLFLEMRRKVRQKLQDYHN